MEKSGTTIIAEIPSGIWNFTTYFSLPIDRSGMTVEEYLAEIPLTLISGSIKKKISATA